MTVPRPIVIYVTEIITMTQKVTDLTGRKILLGNK